MPNSDDNFWGEEIFRYSRAQATADGVLIDLTTATDDKGQFLCQQAGFKVPVAITRAVWTKTVESAGNWKADGSVHD